MESLIQAYRQSVSALMLGGYNDDAINQMRDEELPPLRGEPRIRSSRGRARSLQMLPRLHCSQLRQGRQLWTMQLYTLRVWQLLTPQTTGHGS
jgi:hypothetical protein